MSDKVKICPSCNYSDISEADFQVCPRCGLIIAKYFQRKIQDTPETELNRSSTISSESSSFNRILRIIAAITLGSWALFITAAVTHKYTKTRSGTIMWVKEYYPYSSELTTSFLHGVAIESDFLYLVGSYGRSDTHTSQWSIQKRKASDGTLVSEFGEGGLVISAFGPREDCASGVAVDSQYIYIIGLDRTPWGDDRRRRIDTQWRIEKRRLSDGSLVKGFGEGGVVTSNLTPYFELPGAIIIDESYMYVAGSEIPQVNDYQWRIEKRRLSDGSLVPDFGIGGIVRNNLKDSEGSGGSESVNAMAMGDGNMYVVGLAYTSTWSDKYWRIEKRRLGDGSLIKEFGTDGFIMSNPSPYRDVASGIAIDNKSMFVVGDETRNPVPLYVEGRIEKRSLSDGAFIGEFGQGGVVMNNSQKGQANGITLDQEPSIWKKLINLDLSSNQRCMYVVGIENYEKSGIRQWRIEKRKMNNGAICSEFGKNGVVNIDPGFEFKVARLIAADTDFIYVSGFRVGSNTSSIIKIKK